MKKLVVSVSDSDLRDRAGYGKHSVCSVFSVTAKDKTIISGRTMESGYDMGYAVIVHRAEKASSVPRPMVLSPQNGSPSTGTSP